MATFDKNATAFPELRQEAVSYVAGAIKCQLDVVHGPGHSADWVHGYWQACTDIASVFGLKLDPPQTAKGK